MDRDKLKRTVSEGTEEDPRAKARRFIDDNPHDPRSEPFHHKDGYRRVSLVLPNPDDRTSWLCPRCGKPATEFYGKGLAFEDNRYAEPDERLCLACWHVESHGTPKEGE